VANSYRRSPRGRPSTKETSSPTPPPMPARSRTLSARSKDIRIPSPIPEMPGPKDRLRRGCLGALKRRGTRILRGVCHAAPCSWVVWSRISHRGPPSVARLDIIRETRDDIKVGSHHCFHDQCSIILRTARDHTPLQEHFHKPKLFDAPTTPIDRNDTPQKVGNK